MYTILFFHTARFWVSHTARVLIFTYIQNIGPTPVRWTSNWINYYVLFYLFDLCRVLYIVAKKRKRTSEI